MTVSLVVPHPAMPGYNNVELDEVHSLSSSFTSGGSYTKDHTIAPGFMDHQPKDVSLSLSTHLEHIMDLSEPDLKQSNYPTITWPSCPHFPQSTMASTTSGMFSFSHTEPSADLLSGSSWATTVEGPQNFQDFSDNGSAHSGEAEEYIFTSGQATPRGTRVHSQGRPEIQNTWNTRTAPSMTQGGQAMSRVSSSRSSGSSLSHTSQLSSLDVTGNASAFRNGSQPGSVAGIDSCLLLESEPYWHGYTLDMGLSADATFTIPDASPLHVVPAHMQLGPDVSLTGNSPTNWDCFSSSISRSSSPATIDDVWNLAGSPNSSPELACQSPSSDRKVTISEDVAASMPAPATMPKLEEPLSLPPAQAFTGPRRQGSDGESARDHDLYKKAAPMDDGLYHCPWEGTTSCNHKPEKLKCNYDKFVDSHLKPYRCKAESCEGARFSSTACLLRHEREAHGLHGHGDKPFLCIYEGCERAVPGNGFPRQWNLRDHMKRVHNDHGSAGGSPPSGAATQTKGRKRKTDVPETQTSSRKAAVKSMPAAEPKDTSRPLLDQWMEHRKAVESMIQGLVQPEDTGNIKQIQDVQGRLSLMLKLTNDLNAPKVGTNFNGTG